MAEQRASSYFRKLCDLLLAVEVTGDEGSVIPLETGTRRAVDVIERVKTTRAKAMVIGNGGSAAIASHLQNDLCKAVGLRGLAFNEQPLLTAVANDDGYGSVFEMPVSLWANPGDLMFAISSSGQSENILRAVRRSRDKECQVITLSGFRADNPLRALGHINFYVANQRYGFVELAHTVLAHFLTDCASNALEHESAARS